MVRRRIGLSMPAQVEAHAAPRAADVIADDEEPTVPEVAEVLVEPVTEPEAEQSDDVPDADRPGFLARLLGR